MLPSFYVSMLIRSISSQREIIAPDGARIRELLHPARETMELKIRYSLAYGLVQVNQSTKSHRLKTSSEVYFILKGQGKLVVDEEAVEVKVGDAIYVPPNATQHVVNTGDKNLEYLVIVDPMWHSADPELELVS